MYKTKAAAEKAGWDIRGKRGNWIARKGGSSHIAETIKDLLYKIGGAWGSHSRK
jgi:hypothetical protein